MSENLGGKMFDKILLVHTLRDLPSLTILLFGNFDKLFIILNKHLFEEKNFLFTTFLELSPMLSKSSRYIVELRYSSHDKHEIGFIIIIRSSDSELVRSFQEHLGLAFLLHTEMTQKVKIGQLFMLHIY